jgi:mono/diheme cytochrome c family protein
MEVRNMFRFLRIGICLAALCSAGLVTQAAETDSNGYTFESGYWYKNGAAYNRYAYKYYQPCYGWYTKYSYTAVNPAAALSPTQPDWRDSLAKYAGKLKLEATEHQAFIESIEKLGLGNVLGSPYGAMGGYSQGYSQVAAIGSTQYGQAAIQTAGFNAADVTQLFQMAMRLQSDQQQLAHAGGEQVRQMVSELGGQVTAAEEIRAKAQAVSTVMAAIKPEARASLVQSFSSAGVGAPVAASNPSKLLEKGMHLKKVQTIFDNNCVGCHKPGAQPGRLDLTDVSRLADTDWNLIVEKIEHPDPAQRMPKSLEGGAALPLPLEDRRLIIWVAGP